MFRVRLAILGAAAALALGTAGVMAMQQTAGSGEGDAHGDAVASAARNCPHGPGDAHGDCVSAVAHSDQDNAQENEQDSSTAQACKAAEQAEDAAEKAPAKGDKAAKAADKTEDKTEQQAFVACVSAGETPENDTGD